MVSHGFERLAFLSLLGHSRPVAGFDDLVTSIPLKDLDALLARPEVIVAGLDGGKGLPVPLGEVMARFPQTGVVRIDMTEDPAEAARRFGPGSGHLLLLKGGVVLRDLGWSPLTVEDLEQPLSWAESLDAAAELRKAMAWLGETPPVGASEFRMGLWATYEQPDEYATVQLKLDNHGKCEHRETRGGFQGMSSSARSGRWRRLDAHVLELHWTVSEDDEEVGWSRDRSRGKTDWREWVRVGWKSGQGSEVRFVHGIVPSLGEGEKGYLRKEIR